MLLGDGGYPVAFWVWSSIPDLAPLEASSTPPSGDNRKYLRH